MRSIKRTTLAASSWVTPRTLGRAHKEDRRPRQNLKISGTSKVPTPAPPRPYRYSRPAGVLVHKLYARSLVLAMDLALRSGIIGADPTQVGHLVQNVRGTQTYGLYLLLGGTSNRPGHHIFRYLLRFPSAAKDSFWGPFLRHNLLAASSSPRRISHTSINFGQISKNLDLNLLIPDPLSQPERALEAGEGTRIVPKFTVPFGQTAQEVGLGLRIFQIP